MKFDPAEGYALAIIAQHKNNRASQKRILQTLSGDAWVVGSLIMGAEVPTQAIGTRLTQLQECATGIRRWAAKLATPREKATDDSVQRQSRRAQRG